MGIAFYLIWISKYKYKKLAVVIFLIQLIFNALWTLFFFGIHFILLVFIDIIILEGLIILTMYEFYKVNKSAVYLLIPYILWVTFALILNLALLVLN